MLKAISIPLPLGMSYPTVNATLVFDPEPVLVDCGLNTSENLAALKSALAEHGLALADISRVLITHPHVDHFGLAPYLADAGAEIWIPDLAADWLADLAANRTRLLDMMLAMLENYGFDRQTCKMVAGFFERINSLFPAIPKSTFRIFPTGELQPAAGGSLSAIPAPGHSNRQVCFYHQETGTLFSADMLLPKAPIPVFEEALDRPGTRYRGLPEMLRSYKTFRTLDARRIYPGHGEPFSDHAALIDHQVDRIHRRIEECRARIAAGTRSLPELLSEMYRYLPAGERLGGLQMLLGYLDVLKESGKVREVETDGFRSFRAD